MPAQVCRFVKICRALPANQLQQAHPAGQEAAAQIYTPGLRVIKRKVLLSCAIFLNGLSKSM